MTYIGKTFQVGEKTSPIQEYKGYQGKTFQVPLGQVIKKRFTDIFEYGEWKGVEMTPALKLLKDAGFKPPKIVSKPVPTPQKPKDPMATAMSTEAFVKDPIGLDIPITAGYITALSLFPKKQNEFIEKNPELVIKVADEYEKYVAPFVRTMYPTKIPLAIAEKVVGRKLAATYEELAEKNPVATAVSGLLGDFYNVALLYQIAGGLGIKAKVAEKMPGLGRIWNPFIRAYIPRAAEIGSVWATKGFLDETTNQFQEGKFNAKNLATQTGKNALFGTLLAAPMSSQSLFWQVTGTGNVLAGLTTMEKYLEDGKIDSNDLLDIGISQVLGMFLGALGAKTRISKLNIDKMAQRNWHKLVGQVGEKHAMLFTQTSNATTLSRMYPDKSMGQIMEMARLLPKGGYHSIVPIRAPYGIEQQIRTNLPQQLKNFTKLNATQQSNVLNEAISKALKDPQIGVSLTDAIFMNMKDILDSVKPEVKPEVKITPTAPKELEPLAQEATKYKSAEEFERAIFGKGITDMSNVELNRIGRIKSIAEGGRYGYDFPNSGLQEGWTRMDKALNDFPELKNRIKDGKVTIYRASPTAEIKPGDWVSTSEKYVATYYLGNDFGRTKLGKIEVPITDLYIADVKSASKLKVTSEYPTQLVEEMVYAPKNEVFKLSKSQLTDIWNKAQTQAVKGVEPDIIQNQNYESVVVKRTEQGTENLTVEDVATLNEGPKQIIDSDVGIKNIEQEDKAAQRMEEMYAGFPLHKLAEIPVTVRGSKRKLLDAIGSEVVRYWGLEPEVKKIFIQLAGENELRKESLSRLFTELFQISKEDAKQLTYHQEKPSEYPISNELKEHAEKVRHFINLSREVQESRPGLQKEFFPKSFINRAEKKIKEHKEVIPKLVQDKAINRHKQEIERLQEYVEFLSKLDYVPHMYLQSEEIQRNILRLLPEGKLTSTFRSGLTKLKGREIATLDDAKELGLLPEEDIRVLLATHFEYLYRKVAIYDAIEELKKNPTAMMKESEAPDEWEKVAISQLNGYKVNPFLVDTIEDMSTKPQTNIIARGYDALNSLGKALFFYNPIILPFWDLFQAYGAGSIRPWRPIYSSKLILQAIKDVTNKTEMYEEAVKRQVYSTPSVGRYSQPIEETTRLLIDKIDKENPGWKKTVETIMGERINWKTLSPMTIYKQNWRITWGIDRMIRTATLRHSLNKGMDMDTAAKYTNNFHANYNLFTTKAKRNLNRVFLVPTYKANMLVNLPSYIAKQTFDLGKALGTGKKPTAEQKASFFAIWRILLLGAGAMAWFGYNDYELREDYRFIKKLDEPEMSPEGKILTERVITLPGPFVEWFKITGRIKQQGLQSVFMYLAKVPQIAWGLARNARWNGDPYFDEGAAEEVQKRQIINNMLKDYLAPYGQYDMMTREEQDAFSNIMGFFGMATYKRGSTENRISWEINDRKQKVQTYLRKMEVSWEDKEKAVRDFEIFMEEKIKELESFQEFHNK